MNPEPLHGSWFLHGLWGGQQDSVDDPTEVSQVEQVVGLGGGGEEVLHGLFVGGQGALDQLIHAGLELITEASEITSGHNRLEIMIRKSVKIDQFNRKKLEE